MMASSDSQPVYALLLKGGHVIDPKANIDGQRDVAIAGQKIAAVEVDIDPAQAAQVVDVTGYIVTPGLVDMHVHVYHTRAPEGDPEGLSVVADAHSFRSGVTTMVDTGTAGARHLRHFKLTVIDRAKTRILAYVNIVDQGMLGDFEQDPRHFDPELAASVVLAYPDICVGIKTAHYWTNQPWDDLHTPWAAVGGAIQAGAILQNARMPICSCKGRVRVTFTPTSLPNSSPYWMPLAVSDLTCLRRKRAA